MRTGSSCARRCSKSGGSESVCPSVSSGSSAREPGPERRDLEEDAARLAEVDRAEVEAVDDRRRPAPDSATRALPRLVLVHRRRPGDVVDGARAPEPGSAGAGRSRSAPPRRAARLPARVSASARSPASPRGRRGSLRVDVYARTPSKPWSASSSGISGWSRDERRVRVSTTRNSCSSPSGSREAEPVAVAARRRLAAEPVGPEVERAGRRDPPHDRGAPSRRLRGRRRMPGTRRT